MREAPECIDTQDASSIGEQQIATKRRIAWMCQAMAAGFCVLFGIALIVNSQLSSDGSWFWYAVLHHAGKRLYADMHVVLQPFFVLETETWMSLAGKGWIVSKVPAVIHLLVFTAGIALLSTQNRLRDMDKALFTAFAFFVAIDFEAYRFDDFHVVLEICFLFSILLLLKLDQELSAKHSLSVAALLGLLSGLAISDRSTDGMALFCSTFLAILCLAKRRRAMLLGSFVAVAAAVVVGLIAATGDSFGSYLANTLFAAAGAKGGAGNVLIRPLLLPVKSLQTLYENPWHSPWIVPRLLICVACLAAAASWAVLVRRVPKSARNSVIKSLVGLIFLGGTVVWVVPQILQGRDQVIESLLPLWVLLALGIALFAICKVPFVLFGPGGKACPKIILLLLPVAVLLSGAMSSGGYPHGLVAPIAIFALLLPIVFPVVFERALFRSAFLALAVLMTLSVVRVKVSDPVGWNAYRTYRMFKNREIVRHPVYGPMVIDKDLNSFANKMCAAIGAGGKGDLLSLPFPYLNYYCDIPPWQDYVQSFFDMSGRAVIDGLIAKLQKSPPKWVLYQRQLWVLELHERVYNRGERLPHRDLDDFIMKKVATKEWKLVREARYGPGNDWLLLETQ